MRSFGQVSAPASDVVEVVLSDSSDHCGEGFLILRADGKSSIGLTKATVGSLIALLKLAYPEMKS
jgi:hypothetical protein